MAAQQPLPDMLVAQAYDRLMKGDAEPGDRPLIVLGALRGDFSELLRAEKAESEKMQTLIDCLQNGAHANGSGGLRERAKRSAPPVVLGGGLAAIIFKVLEILSSKV